MTAFVRGQKVTKKITFFKAFSKLTLLANLDLSLFPSYFPENQPHHQNWGSVNDGVLGFPVSKKLAEKQIHVFQGAEPMRALP